MVSKEAGCCPNGRRLVLPVPGGPENPPVKGQILVRKGGSAMIDMMTLMCFSITMLTAGIAIGRFIEKIDRFLRLQESKNHDCTSKNDRPRSRKD